ncbi:hypothetical protein JCM16106_20200 [Hydrogenophilus islandicus]
MEFEWDEAKGDACFTERGFDFAYAAQAFFDSGRSNAMGTVRMTIDPADATTAAVGRIDEARVDATTDEEIARQIAEDEREALQEAARYARRIRSRLGLSQVEFSRCINVSLDTVRKWEQGKRCPSGAAKALLKVLDKAPEAALAALK